MLKSFLLASIVSSAFADCVLPDARPPVNKRTFVSKRVEEIIANYSGRFKNQNLATLFSNTFPNTLDTTVYAHVPGNDTFLITGDIAAMWLRDSTNQIWPYLPFIVEDSDLLSLVQGLIKRQLRSVNIDPYANAFQYDDLHGLSPHATEDTTSVPLFAGTSTSAYSNAFIFERKFELDSLSNVLRLSARYFNLTGDLAFFDSTLFNNAAEIILSVFESQQQDTMMEDKNGGPSYVFQRLTSEPSDSLEHGRGFPVRYTGMIKSNFRGSDDSVVYSFNIPENAFASVALQEIIPLLQALNRNDLVARAEVLYAAIIQGINTYGIINHPVAGLVYAFEADGFSNYIFMDDPNIPGLISMPYYGFTDINDPLYLNTVKAVTNPLINPWWIDGTNASATLGGGLAGPHNGLYWIWPMAYVSFAWNTQNVTIISELVDLLVESSACSGLLHESYDVNSVFSWTRNWFSWMNGYFADLILKIARENPAIIFNNSNSIGRRH
jgi:uncharacterized protein